jgi:hypothetical protein
MIRTLYNLKSTFKPDISNDDFISNIIFLDKDNIGEDYVSNYPIKGYVKGQLIVQDDYPLNLELTIRNDIGNITIMEGAEVNILSKINEKQRSYYLFKDAKLNFNQETKIEELSLQMQNRSKLSFKDLKSDKVFLQGDGTSDLELNGEIKFLDKYKYDDINLKGDYKIDSIKERKIKMFTISTPIPFNSSISRMDTSEVPAILPSRILIRTSLPPDMILVSGCSFRSVTASETVPALLLLIIFSDYADDIVKNIFPLGWTHLRVVINIH